MTNPGKPAGAGVDPAPLEPFAHLRGLEGAAAGSPASEALLRQGRRQLEALELAMPPELAAFLRRMDGFFWNGIQIFPIASASIQESGFIVPTLLGENDKIVGRVPPTWLQVGGSDEEHYFYLPARKTWAIVDRTGLDVYEAFGSLGELLAFVLTERRGWPAGAPLRLTGPSTRARHGRRAPR